MSEVNRQRQNSVKLQTNVPDMRKGTKSQHTLYMKLIVTDKIMFCYKKRSCNENSREKFTNTIYEVVSRTKFSWKQTFLK